MLSKKRRTKGCEDLNQKNLSTHFKEDDFLGNKRRADLFIQYVTLFRRNYDIFVEKYLGIKLFLYQKMVMHFMGISTCFVMVAARALAKSFMIALWACTVAILYPKSNIIICSGTKGQAKLIISEKIKRELQNMSPALRNEIETISDSANNQSVTFKNGSQIIVVAASDNSRGWRGTAVIYEEFRLIKKNVIDSVISPFLVPRQPPYLANDSYRNVQALIEEPKEAYISSAWFKSHWMWKQIVDTSNAMFSEKPSYLFGFDYSTALFHKIKTRSQLQRDKTKFDPMTWAMEYENSMLQETEGSYFTYAELKARQNVVKAMYPRRSIEKKVSYGIKKTEGEIRILSCDIAMMAGKENDNSVFSCIRMLPTSQQSYGDSAGYQLQVPYLEALQGGITSEQAIRINQLYNDLDCDYIVLDVRGNGIGVLDALGKVSYDEERDCEYSPMAVFNDDEYAKRTTSQNARQIIYAYKGSLKKNSDIAVTLKTLIVDGKIDFLVDNSAGIEYLIEKNSEYISANIEDQLFFEHPYLETMVLINECVDLRYDKMDGSNAVRLKESSTGRKDRYVSVAMGCYFASQLEHDLLADSDEIKIESAPSCVSNFIL